ncbi:MAG: hypothetical protein PF549_03890 [Patescibacteria group bacterium]|jgi:pimeloyl-ACP methyl ester carboxylesterase|nr:hypothetical protein [Patescibacteria group bacterium]
MSKIENSLKKTLVILLAIVFLFSPFSFYFNNFKSNQVIAEDPEDLFPDDQDRIIKLDEGAHRWGKNDEIEIDGAVVVKSGAILAIEAGTVIKFKREEGEIAPFIYVEEGGMILAEGTESEKIVFTSDEDNSHFSLIFDGNNAGSKAPSGLLRYVEISKAGGLYEFEKPVQAFSPLSLNKALAEEDTVEVADDRYPVRHLGGTLVMENCRFYDNQSADLYISENEIDPREFDSNEGPLISIVNSNFEENETGIAVIDNHFCPDSDEIPKRDCMNLVALKNNYYGKATGPFLVQKSYDYYLEHKNESILDDEFGAKIIGENLYYQGFKRKDLIADPLIIIPGITGSACPTKIDLMGEIELDPILHTYDDLRESLTANGYEKKINLFEFPYEWRNSNMISAQKLQEGIREIQEETLMSRVDLVAHSMGGLVARKYIQSDQFERNVDQLVTLGTPHRGSPEAYLQWEAGEGFFGPKGFLAKHHFRMEAVHNGYLSLFKYIRDEVPSISELLPDYDYLEENGEMRVYPENYPQNSFLEDLNQNGLEKLDQIRFLNIVGETEEESTITKIKVADETDEEKWEHGKPENFDNENYREGLIAGEGDETVPSESATGTEKGKILEVESSHGDLPTEAQCEVFHELTGSQVCTYRDEIDIPNIILFNVFSPVDIQIIDPDGKIVGKDFENDSELNQIDLAYYSGFETENEFVAIPNPKDGEYKIKTQGTGEGNYRIESILISEDDESTEGASESIVSFEGEAMQGEIEESLIEVSGGIILEKEPDDNLPESPEEDTDENDEGEIVVINEIFENRIKGEESQEVDNDDGEEDEANDDENDDEDEEEDEDEDKDEGKDNDESEVGEIMMSQKENVKLASSLSDFKNKNDEEISLSYPDSQEIEVLGIQEEDKSVENENKGSRNVIMFFIAIVVLLTGSVIFWKIRLKSKHKAS